MRPLSGWRTGRSVGRTIYDINDKLIGVMDTPQLADEVVHAVNWMRDHERAVVHAEAEEDVADEDTLKDHKPGDNIEIDPQAIAEYTEGLNAMALVRRVERLSGQLAETQIIRDAYLDYGEQNDVNFGKEALTVGPRQEKPEEDLMDGQPHPHPKTPDLQEDLIYGFGHLVSSYITDDAHSGDSGDLAQEVFESLGMSDYTIKILELVAEHVWGNYEYTGKEVQATREMFGDAEVQTVKVEVNIDTTKLDKILRPVPVDVTFVDAAGKEIPPDRLEFFVGLRDRVEVDLTEQMRVYAANPPKPPHMGFLQPYPPTENPGKLTMKVTEDTWNKPETDVDADSVAAPEEEA